MGICGVDVDKHDDFQNTKMHFALDCWGAMLTKLIIFEYKDAFCVELLGGDVDENDNFQIRKCIVAACFLN